MDLGYTKRIRINYKSILVIFMFFLSFSTFAFEGLSKQSQTLDGYSIRIYQIDKNEHPNSFEYYVQLTSNNSEEYFTWCFNSLVDSMEHFNWLKDNKVVYTLTFYESPVSLDCRRSWRQYAYDADTAGTYINYWISKKQRLSSYGFQQDWR